MERATLAGGCFWCTEAAFLNIDGVHSTRVGYTGGAAPDPTYEEVCTGITGHREALEILFDPEHITYMQLLEIFFKQIDPVRRRRAICRSRRAVSNSDLLPQPAAEEAG